LITKQRKLFVFLKLRKCITFREWLHRKERAQSWFRP
jgi:hypothetical protein